MEIKSVMKKKKQKNDKFLGFWYHYKMAVTWLLATFLISIRSFCRVQHTVSIFDQFCFSLVFLGLPKIGPNRYT